MERFLPEEEEDSSLELSELELDELITTKFIDSKQINDDDEEIETARAVASPMDICLSPHGEDVILEDYAFFARPEKDSSDFFVVLLDRVQKSSESDLKKFELWDVYERSRKTKNASRVSELAVIDFLVTSLDRRPTLLHLFCRRLVESDMPNILLKALVEVVAPTKFRSVFRVTTKTEMPLKQFICQLEKLWTDKPIQIQDMYVTAVKKYPDGMVQKYRTMDIKWFSEMEHKVANVELPTNVAAHFLFSVIDKPFVNVRVDFYNDVGPNGRRNKSIIIEQVVTPVNGPWTIGRATLGHQLVEKIHEYELDEGLPFHSLKFKIQDLNQFLEAVDPVSFKNVTTR